MRSKGRSFQSFDPWRPSILQAACRLVGALSANGVIWEQTVEKTAEERWKCGDNLIYACKGMKTSHQSDFGCFGLWHPWMDVSSGLIVMYILYTKREGRHQSPKDWNQANSANDYQTFRYVAFAWTKGQPACSGHIHDHVMNFSLAGLDLFTWEFFGGLLLCSLPGRLQPWIPEHCLQDLCGVPPRTRSDWTQG